MTRPQVRRILVTGATGRLGTHTCRVLVARGHDVVATDQKYRRDFPVRVVVGDLKDEGFVHSVVEGCDAVVHLGNHPHAGAGPSRQGILAENTAINANVFYAAADRGVKTIVFASSVQAMLRCSGSRGEGPFEGVPYFPLDGAAPTNPGSNPYGLSKEFGERLLRLACEADDNLSATSLRFPMLPDESWLERIAQGIHPSSLNWADCITYLPFPEAATLIALVVERNRSGYSQYFPAQTFEIDGHDVARIAQEHYPGTPLRCPLAELHDLVDDGFARELGLELRARVRARFVAES